MSKRLALCRTLLLAGLGIGLLSWWETVTHIGNPRYILPSDFPEGTTHAWYHAFREAFSDVAQMSVFLLVFFGPADLRSRPVWWLMLLLMVGYYGAFWAGQPFLAALSAPSRIAGAVHPAMAAFSLAALIVARPLFVSRPSGAPGPAGARILDAGVAPDPRPFHRPDTHGRQG